MTISLAKDALQVSPAWRAPIAALVAGMLAVVWSHWESATSMVDVWSRSETYTHAFLVLPIVLWLVWQRKAALGSLQPHPSWSALVPMLAMSFLWWLGRLADVDSARHFALVGLLVSTVPLVMGWRISRELAFPLLFAFFAVPIGEFMTPTLMHWTAEALVAGLRFTGVPVYQEGQQLAIPTGRWAVVDACSGVRYLMATLMAGSLFAYLNFRTMKRRIVFMAASLVVPVLANWLRAYIIVMLGHLSNNRLATGVDHLVYGWVFFGAVVMALFYIGARWSDVEVDAPVPPAPAAVVVPTSWPAVAAVLVAAIVASQWPTWIDAFRAGQPVASRHLPNLLMPAENGSWRGGAPIASTWAPVTRGAVAVRETVYEGADGSVGVHMAYYRHQDDGAKLISSVNRWVQDQQAWNIVSQGQHTVPLQQFGAVTWRSAVLLSHERQGPAGERVKLVAWKLYWIGGHLTSSDAVGKLWQAWQSLLGRPDDAAVIYLYTLAADEGVANRRLVRFAAENFDMLQRTLTAAAQQH